MGQCTISAADRGRHEAERSMTETRCQNKYGGSFLDHTCITSLAEHLVHTADIEYWNTLRGLQEGLWQHVVLDWDSKPPESARAGI